MFTTYQQHIHHIMTDKFAKIKYTKQPRFPICNTRII